MNAVEHAAVRPWSAAWPRFAVLVLAITAVTYLWMSRLLFLDDAFIHLRIAHGLLAHGFYSFNGDRPAYCSSSPLFTAVLAFLSWVYSGDYLPKIVDVIVYGGLFAALARRLVAVRTASAQWLSLAFLVAATSPLAMRWLTDGMETGLSGLVAVLLGAIAFDVYREAPRPGIARLVAYGVFAGLAVTLRIEFCFLVAMIGVASLTAYRRVGFSALAIALGTGAALGLVAIYATFGSLLPDTAIAKAHALAAFTPLQAAMITFGDVLKGHAAASSFGVLMLVAGGISAVQAARHGRNRLFVIVLNAGFILLLALIVWREQAIQGYRYFVFIEFFLLAFNIAVLDETGANADAPASVTESPRSSPRVAVLAGIIGLVFIGWQAFDLSRLDTITAGRSASFEKFETTDLHGLYGSYGIAWDVGMIGYFSHATILDANGLVNGREVARMAPAERLRSFVAEHPIRFVFVGDGQLAALHEVLDVSGWRALETFDFPNFSGRPDRHYLLVRPER
jgi:hypothetical protein